MALVRLHVSAKPDIFKPLSEEAVRDVVRTYFRAFEREDIVALAQLLTPDAVSLDARGMGRGAILEAWKARLKTLNYSKLAGVLSTASLPARL